MNKFSKIREEKVHYKMYKAGKQWLFAGLATISLGLGLGLSQGNVKADTSAEVSATERTTASSAVGTSDAAKTPSQGATSQSTEGASTAAESEAVKVAEQKTETAQADQVDTATPESTAPANDQQSQASASQSVAAKPASAASSVTPQTSNSTAAKPAAEQGQPTASAAPVQPKAATNEAVEETPEVHTKDTAANVATDKAESIAHADKKVTEQPEADLDQTPKSTKDSGVASQTDQLSDKKAAIKDAETQADQDMNQLVMKGTSAKLSMKLQSKLMPKGVSLMMANDEPATVIKTGYWGSSEWKFMSDGTLSIGEGTLSTVNKTNNPLKDFAKDIKKIMIAPNTKAPVDSSYLFSQPDGSGLPNVTYIQGENLNVKNTQNFARMFQNDKSLKSVDVGKWNVKNAVMVVHFPDDNHLGAMYQMFDGASSLQTLDLSSWDTFAFQTAGGFGWLAMQDMLRGTSSLWKITLGPNTFLAALSDFGGTVVIQNAPGNNQKIGDSDEPPFYASIDQTWQMVGNGTDHSPAGRKITPEEIQKQVNDGQFNQPVTFVWSQVQLEVAKVHFIRSIDGQELGTTDTEPTAKGEQLSLVAGSKFLTKNMPAGYHLSSKDQLPANAKQPTSLTFGTDKNVNIYVTSDKPYFKAVTIRQVEVDQDGNVGKTLSSKDIFAFAGDTITTNTNDPEWKAPWGYEVVPQDTAYTVPNDASAGTHTIDIQYKKLQVATITVNYVNTKTGKTIGQSNPVGDAYGIIDLGANSTHLDIPAGYHYATTPTELGSNTQPTTLEFKQDLQTTNVYVAPDEIKAEDVGAITVHYYLDKSTTKIQEDRKVGGFVGDTITINAQDAEQTIAGYTLVPGQAAQSLTLDGKAKEAVFYYTANDTNNITVKYIDTTTGNEISSNTPAGHTGEDLNLGSDSKQITIPEGYHYATQEELKDDQQQPSTLTWKTTDQEAKVYVTGNEVKMGDVNAITVHYYVEATTDKVKEDASVGGKVGDQVTIDPAAVNGYRLVDGQAAKKLTLDAKNGQTVIFYYKANEQKNITIAYVDTNTGKEVGTSTPDGHTNEKLNLGSDSPQISVPEGYHYATPEELQGKHEQPTDLTWTTDEQKTTVYVVGNDVKDTDANAVKVHYYLNHTEQSLKPDDSFGGKVGSPVTITPVDIKGYTGIDGQSAQVITLDAKNGQTVTFYYEANPQNNITVTYINQKTGDKIGESENPSGHTGEKLDLGEKSPQISVPEGYHYATPEELDGTQKQPTEMTWTTDDQDAKIFVVGNQVNPGDTNAITVHYYLDKTTTSLQTDGSIGGKVGDSVTVNPATIDGYSLAAGQNPQTLKLDAKKGQTVTFYYQADDQNNITVNLVDLNTGKQVGDPQVPAGHTGEELNLGKDSDKITIPDGYHYATPDELPVGTTQPGNLTWTTDKQDTKVYVIGNEVEKTDANAVMVHHYLESTTTALKVDDQLGGRVGGQVTAKPAEIAGYTLVDGQTEQVLTLDAKQGQTVTFYYKADDQNNITITYVDTNTGKEVGTPQQPTGHTGEELNLGKDSDKITIPDGYHYATPEELPAGTTQPGNLTWTPDKQATKVYVTGNKVGEGDTNAITVHYFVENTTKSLKADDSIGGTIGVPVTVNPAEIKGYTLVDGQTAQTIMLDAKKGQTVTFYYQADDQNNITVTLVDPKTGTQVGTPQQPAGHTGEELNLGKDSDKVTIPDGYHYATPEELPAGTTQPGNLTWTTDEQATKVYVIGNEVKETDENAVTVHHYLENTTTSLKTDDKIGGRVGVEVTASPAQINGYTLVDGQTAQTLTLDAKKGQTVTFYYKADPQNNITVTLVDPNTGKPVGDPQQPAGHTGEELDLGQDSDKITIPDGYHYATPDELPTGTTQPGNLTWTPDKQDTKVYVVGNEVKETDENAVTVHHYLESTTTSLKADDKLGGRVGGEVTAKPAEIAGYTLVDGQTAQVLTLDAKKGQTVTFYYKADGQNNITITYVDTNSNKEVGTSTPAGHTGEELNLGKDSDKITIPEGYHYATPEELPAGMEQPKNTTWTTTEQATKVYVTGNKVQDKDANAITVHYFVENTTTSLKADDSIGGTIGVPVTVTPVEIKGYTLADGQAAQTIMLDVKKGQTVTFYYQADDQKNITITYVDTDTGNPIGTSVPTGHTDEKLDLGSDSPQISVPEGYHYATPEELIETQKQPTEMTWTTDNQTAKIYVVGNTIDKSDKNAVTVHHYLTNTTTQLKADEAFGGKVGGQITVNPAEINGYTLVDGQAAKTLTFDVKEGQTVTFYYQADDQNNITVSLIDPNTNKPVGEPQQPAGHTGEELNLGKDSDKITIPEGYHYATPDELPAGTTQPGNLTWTTDKQDTKVYVVGNEVGKTDANAVTVHHYLENTTTSLKVDDQLGGRVGGEVTASPAQISGYTLVDGQTAQTLTLDAKKGQTVIFYYQADDQNNITVTLVDSNTGDQVGNPQQPAGHTGEELNLGKDSDQITIPEGYHYATPDELPIGTTQPGNLTWTTNKQDTKVYVVGNEVKETDENAVKVHHYLEGTTTSLKADDALGGRVGGKVTASPAQIDGYTLVDGQVAQELTLDAKKGQTVTFYYQADDQNNITVNLVDPNTNKPVGEPQQPAGHTGEELNLGKDSDQIMIPEGYHYATPEELPTGTTQPGNLTWTTDKQDTKVYVVGNEVKETDANAVTVHHYLENTTTSLKSDDKLGGRVGGEVTAKPAEIAGYRLVDGQTDQVLTLDAKKGQTVTFYYKADGQSNITITYVDTNTNKEVGTSTPAGHTGEELNLGKDSDKITIPEGYHYATPNELPAGTTQPGNLTWTTDKQDTKVYVVGNEVKETDANAVTVHHYLENTTTSLKVDDALGGRVGGEVTAKPAEIAGYTLLDGQTAQVLTLDAKKGQTVTFYYKADNQNNITVSLVDLNTGKQVGEPQQPAGHTGEELNLGKDSDKITIPEGYHYATPDELPTGTTQPGNLTWTTDKQDTKVYVVGNEVKETDANAVTVHHYLESTTTSLKSDDKIGGRVGGVVTAKPAEIAGYTLVDGQTAQVLTLDAKQGQTVTFYYKADGQNNITITYVDTHTNKEVGTSTPAGHTGEELDLGSNSQQTNIPEGYHYATPDELPAGTKQPGNLTWTTDKQDTKVYVVGNEVKGTDANAVTVHHYLEGTTTSLKADEGIGGRVGGEVTAKPAEIAGYTLVDGQTAQVLTLDAKKGQTVTFYYKADGQNNITVTFVDPKTGKQIGDPQQPAGHTGEELNLGKDSDKITIPEGYHYATPAELPAGTTQPGNLTWTTEGQDTKVYVIGNEVKETDENAVTVHYYLVNTTQSLKDDGLIGGIVGNSVTAAPVDINGYTLVPGQKAQTLTLKAKGGQTVTFYYQADGQNNITVTYTDANTGNVVGTSTPAGHTDEKLNLGSDSKQIDVPAGYHYATPEELKDGQKQPGDLTWTTTDQQTQVYVVGNDVNAGDKNAVTVHYYLEHTTKALKDDDSLGGKVGSPVVANPAQIDGYTLVDGQPAQTLTLKVDEGQTVTFYYKADEQKNITITYKDPTTGNPIGDKQNPTGHTGEELDLGRDNDQLDIPEGYHYATPEELPKGVKQPGNLTWTTKDQDTEVYVIGNPVQPGDPNAVTVHYYAEDTTKSLKDDASVGGVVGSPVTIAPAEIKGYTLVGDQTAKTLILDAKDGHTVTFYYKADAQDNITVTYVDINTDKEVGKDTPSGHTDEQLDLGSDSKQVVIPAGYHYATPDELKDGQQQPKDLTWTTDDQSAKIYVVGNTVGETDENAVTVHHYLEGTTQVLKEDDFYGGKVGDSITAGPAEIEGYTPVDGQQARTVTLRAKDGHELTFYYQADEQKNITITYIDPNTDEVIGSPDTPTGHTGEELNLGPDSHQIDVPDGYHVATPEELKDGQKQPDNLTWTTEDQDTHVYVVGDKVNPGDANAITVHYYEKGTTNPVKPDSQIGGVVGQTITVDPAKETVPGYTLVPGQEAQDWQLVAHTGHDIIFYYTKNAVATGTTTDSYRPVADVQVTTTTNRDQDTQAPQSVTTDKLLPKGEAVYSLKKIYLYKDKNFSKKGRIAVYAGKNRAYRPMFVVIGYAYSKNGHLRYKVRDVNHLSKTNNMVGYITAQWAYVRPVYYQGKHKVLTVINPRGINGYKKKDLTGKAIHYKQGTVLHVKKIVHHNLTTRYVLDNGQYITGNRKLVMMGKHKLPRFATAKHAINRYQNANLTKRNRHLNKGTKVKIKGYDYSHANDVTKTGALRYQIAGGYITGNAKFVKVTY